MPSANASRFARRPPAGPEGVRSLQRAGRNERPGARFAPQPRVEASLIDDDLIARRARFYLCGPEPMMSAITAGLTARGVPRFDIFSEVFRSPAVPNLEGDQRFQVQFARSGGAPVTWSAAQGALLGFGESQGIAMPSGCRVGQCESCAVRLLSGRCATCTAENRKTRAPA